MSVYVEKCVCVSVLQQIKITHEQKIETFFT